MTVTITQWRKAEYGKPCPYCGMEMGEHRKPTRDHVQPRSRGGEDVSANILIVCEPCNQAKANYTIGEFLGALLAVGDARSEHVALLVDEAWGFNSELGVLICADAGIGFVRSKRNKRKPVPNALEREAAAFLLAETQVKRLATERVCEAVAKKLKLERSHWSIDTLGRMRVVLCSKSYAFTVGSEDRLVDKILMEKLRVERSSIDCRPMALFKQMEVSSAA